MSDVVDIPRGRRYIIERCPYCGRRLVEYQEGDSSFNVLHDHAEIEAPQYPSIVEGSARCLRIRCRIRHKLDRNHPA